jgi:hypothetical protein
MCLIPIKGPHLTQQSTVYQVQALKAAAAQHDSIFGMLLGQFCRRQVDFKHGILINLELGKDVYRTHSPSIIHRQTQRTHFGLKMR